MAEAIRVFRGGHSFLSNFHPSEVEYQGFTYRTVEHAYQAAKTLDEAQRAGVAAAKTPGAAKRAGRRVAIRPDWEQVKLTVMADLIALKFAPGTELAWLLLNTGDAHLEEGNTWNDTFWGVCRGRGYNHLGKLLMAHRAALRLT